MKRPRAGGRGKANFRAPSGARVCERKLPRTGPAPRAVDPQSKRSRLRRAGLEERLVALDLALGARALLGALLGALERLARLAQPRLERRRGRSSSGAIASSTSTSAGCPPPAGSPRPGRSARSPTPTCRAAARSARGSPSAARGWRACRSSPWSCGWRPSPPRPRRPGPRGSGPRPGRLARHSPSSSSARVPLSSPASASASASPSPASSASPPHGRRARPPRPRRSCPSAGTRARGCRRACPR